MRLLLYVLAVILISVGSAWCISIKSGSTDQQMDFWVTDSNGDPNLTIDINDYDLFYVEENGAVSAVVHLDGTGRVYNSAHADGTVCLVAPRLIRVWISDAAFDAGIGKHVWVFINDTQAVNSGGDYIRPKEIELGTVSNMVYVDGNAVPLSGAKMFDDLMTEANITAATPTAAANAAEVWAQEALSTLLASLIFGQSTIISGVGNVLETTVATADTASSFTLTAGPEAEGAHLNQIIEVTDATDGHTEGRICTCYTAGRIVTVNLPYSFTPDVGDVVKFKSGYFIPSKLSR